MGLPDPEWRRFRPAVPCGTSVLLLAGSSGRVDIGRAAVLARQGATVLAIRWFGGPGQQPGPYEVPLETIVEALICSPPSAIGWRSRGRRSVLRPLSWLPRSTTG